MNPAKPFIPANPGGEEEGKCCRARDNCYAQVDYLGNCALLIRNPYTSSYSYSCSGTEITCSARAIAQNISLQAVWQFGNAFECILPLPVPTKEYTAYGCYCGLSSWIPFLEDLDPM
ncbi:phospholipase A2-like protein [Cricetulus griseus]|uniref:Phospholipase A2-like protein n=1 Tax=Cricetulus griseus TaxID=10029 RepID=A0A061I268_CRIGR|nr:phospholipase A2-like protein [Cricetulus griseus]